MPQTTPTKRRAVVSSDPPSGGNADAARVDKDATEIDGLIDTRRRLLKLFCALETTMLSTRSASSFHAVQRAVSTTARCDFALRNLAQIMGVWPDAYELDSAMALVDGVRKPSVSIMKPMDSDSSTTTERRDHFADLLQVWRGAEACLPELKEQTLMPLNHHKIASIRNEPGMTSPSTRLTTSSSSPSAKERQSALLDRIRIKALTKSTDPTSEDLKAATISALIPLAITSIKILLASRKTKAIGMTELCDNLATSLSQRISRKDIEGLIEQLSRHEDYAKWCKVGSIGEVKMVRFIGPVPRPKETQS